MIIFSQPDVFLSGHIELWTENIQDDMEEQEKKLTIRNKHKIQPCLSVTGVVSLFKHQLHEMLEKLDNVIMNENIMENDSDILFPDFYLGAQSSGKFPPMITFEGSGRDFIFGKTLLINFINQLREIYEQL